ncbi:MAG: hypothetical protein NTX88_09560, partial [Candidatus Atribacteria bacterium]|nr:hypothetical protein [Candidatus Atribacteria bacterium]
MSFPYEKILREEAEKFVTSIGEAGLSADIVPNSFREYSVKIVINCNNHPEGYIPIYYSPRKKTFTIHFQELKNKALAPVLEKHWNQREKKEDIGEISIYVDGSHLHGRVGFGVVILKGQKVEREMSGPVPPQFRHSRQVGGELFAVQEALQWCRDNRVPEVSIYYDYLGIEKWAQEQWKTNIPLTQHYAESVKNSGVMIHWHKVKSHTGNRWNEQADALARKGTIGKKEEEPLV